MGAYSSYGLALPVSIGEAQPHLHIPTPCTSAGVKEHPDRCVWTPPRWWGLCHPSPHLPVVMDCGWGELTQHFFGLTHPFNPFPLLVVPSTERCGQESWRLSMPLST